MPENDTAIGGQARVFPATRHSLVLDAAGDTGSAPESREAICAIYWKPVYAWLRAKWGRSNEDAKDLTQGFFAMLFSHGLLADYRPELGTFRGWIRGCADNFVRKQSESDGRQKRGGGAVLIETDGVMIPSGENPEETFLREWRRQIFTLALDDLANECRADPGLQQRYAAFERYDLADEPRPRYEDIARELGISTTAVTNHLAWARRELRRLALARLGPVTAGRSEARAEGKALFGS